MCRYGCAAYDQARDLLFLLINFINLDKLWKGILRLPDESNNSYCAPIFCQAVELIPTQHTDLTTTHPKIDPFYLLADTVWLGQLLELCKLIVNKKLILS